MRKEDYLSVIEELVYQVTGISELTPDTDFIRGPGAEFPGCGKSCLCL